MNSNLTVYGLANETDVRYYVLEADCLMSNAVVVSGPLLQDIKDLHPLYTEAQKKEILQIIKLCSVYPEKITMLDTVSTVWDLLRGLTFWGFFFSDPIGVRGPLLIDIKELKYEEDDK